MTEATADRELRRHHDHPPFSAAIGGVPAQGRRGNGPGPHGWRLLVPGHPRLGVLSLRCR